MTSLVVVTSGFPRVSETFALNELLALRARGMLTAIFATKQGDWSRVQPQVAGLSDLVHLLPDGDVEGQAAALVGRLGSRPVTAVHGYFAHQPAAVAAAAAGRLGVPYGFSAHALDIRKIPRGELLLRAGLARGVITCNTETAAALRAARVAAYLVPHGVDVTRFEPGPARASRRDQGTLRVLAVGRLVRKKGFSVLIEALARLDDGVTLRLVGSGPEEPRLRAALAHHRLAGRVELAGPRTHDELPAEFEAADVVVVPSIVDPAGDRDGLPNVLLEAMACGRPVVASDVAAVSDAVLPGSTGLLVAPGDVSGLADALQRLRNDAQLLQRLGSTARRRAVERFELTRCTSVFCRRLEALYG